MGRPRTSRSTIKKDPLDAVIPLPEANTPTHAMEQVVNRTARQSRADKTENTDQAVEPTPTQAKRLGRQKLTVHLPAELVNRVKNAAYWNPRLTIAKIAEQGIRTALERVERENGGPYPEREGELVGGRPIK